MFSVNVSVIVYVVSVDEVSPEIVKGLFTPESGLESA